MSATPQPELVRKQFSLLRRMQRSWVPYSYIAPFYILFLIFMAFPIVFSLYLGLHSWDGLSPMMFVGLGNFQRLIGDPIFWRALSNTLFIGVVAHIPMLTFALIVAYILDSRFIRFQHFYRTIYFIPVVTSSVAISIVFTNIFGFRAGLINAVLVLFGGDRINWLGGQGEWIRSVIMTIFIWRWLGWNMVIYLAGLQAIPGELYESARIDGATWPQILFRISLPLIKPVVLFSLVLSVVGTFTLFDEPFVVAGIEGGPNRMGLTLMVYLYRNAFRFSRFGYAASVALVMTLMTVIVSVVNIRTFKEKG